MESPGLEYAYILLTPLYCLAYNTTIILPRYRLLN
jgi:hypothetical protein